MSKLPYMPLYVDDYEAATAHLTLEEDGIYNRLLRLCWRTSGCSVPDDPSWIARRMRVDLDTYHRLVEPIIKEFFGRANGRVSQRRQRAEYQKANEVSRKRSEAGKKGGRPHKPLKTKETGESRVKANRKQNESIHNHSHKESSVSKDTGGSPPEDEKNEGVEKTLTEHIFGSGLRFLCKSGITEKNARSTLGMWRKKHGDERLLAALGRAQREGALDPVAFCEGVFRTAGSREVDPAAGFNAEDRAEYERRLAEKKREVV